MPKKTRQNWRRPEAQQNPARSVAEQGEPFPPASDLPISPAQLAANRANAQLSTGPRSEAGKATSSRNAVKSALTGRTVLLPTDDRDEYAAFLAEFQNDLQPVGQLECELVQIIVDCHWRLRRIQELEYALYAHGEEQFADAFADCPEQDRRSKIILQTHLAYQKELRNLHIQESRIDRKRKKALDEFHQLQAQRLEQNQEGEAAQDDLDGFSSEAEYFAALDAGYVPPSIAERYYELTRAENGFVFSNSAETNVTEPSLTSAIA